MSDLDKWKDLRYKAPGPGYWRVVGVITEPALILENPITRKQMTQVIGCPNHREMETCDKDEALEEWEHLPGHFLNLEPK